jgi:hypothetical protein
MNPVRSVRNTGIAAGIVLALVVGGAGPAMASTQRAGTTSVVSSTVLVQSASTTISSSIAASSSGSGSIIGGEKPSSSGSSTNALPAFMIRAAVKAALAVLKKTSRSTYNTLVSYVAKGRTAFVNWWNKTGKKVTGGLVSGVAAGALYDALKWVLGF